MTIVSSGHAAGIVALVQERKPADTNDKPEPEGMNVINCVALNSGISSTNAGFVGRVVGRIEVGYSGIDENPAEYFLYDITAGIIPGIGPWTLDKPIVISGNLAHSGLTAVQHSHNDAARNGIDTTDSLLRTKSTYTSLGWEFDPVKGPWKMPGPDGAGYPKLFWEED